MHHDACTLPAPFDGLPDALAHVHQPPRLLHLRGKLPPLPGIAVVGTRRISSYGRLCVERLVPGLVRLGLTVVSGLALGVDGAAHETALAHGGRTLAVLGSGIDDASIYPRAHAGLARRILAGRGALMSEYPPGTEAAPWRFPERNRIVAGLSRAVLVIEAPAASGAMITARMAMESGLDVWAVPGPIHHTNTEGPHRLIRQGAAPITCVEDMAEALGMTLPDAASVTAAPDEQALLDVLKREPASADDLSAILRQDAKQIAALLTALELRGRIRSLGGGRFTLYS